jgi:hypothetical protein
MPVASARVLHGWKHTDLAAAQKEIWDAVGDIDGVEVFHDRVLLAVYVRPVYAGSIITLSDTQREDIYQGPISMVLKIGPDAFRESEVADFNGRLPVIGDWVYGKIYDAWNCSVQGEGAKATDRKDKDGRGWEGWPCRIIESRYIYGRVKLPHSVV